MLSQDKKGPVTSLPCLFLGFTRMLSTVPRFSGYRANIFLLIFTILLSTNMKSKLRQDSCLNCWESYFWWMRNFKNVSVFFFEFLVFYEGHWQLPKSNPVSVDFIFNNQPSIQISYLLSVLILLNMEWSKQRFKKYILFEWPSQNTENSKKITETFFKFLIHQKIDLSIIHTWILAYFAFHILCLRE